MSHTPGPWNYEEPDVVGLPHLRAANGDAVATFLREPWNSSDIPLIAAAPELYEAIQTVDMALAGQKTSLEEWANISKTVRAALTKARGGLFDEAEYRHLLEDKKTNKLSPQEEERLIQLYEEGEVDDIPSFFLRSDVEQKIDSLIEMIDDLTQKIKTQGENNA